ncbi:MAG: succinylglutamate desuccinylase/aspartoacylase family protein [Planctomycetaceae bacterium]|nr:succinylglutamate desuccinylase/aspartoacylase family protein [Planctomycetaceae bacterium]
MTNRVPPLTLGLGLEHNSRMQINIRHRQTNRHAAIQRRLGAYGQAGGPTLVVIAGIHGNEPSGVFAFLELLEELKTAQVELFGRIVGLAGNLSALQQGVRFVDRDLNRVWLVTENKSESIDSTNVVPPLNRQPEWRSDPLIIETRERDELYQEIRQILAEGQGPHYFIDLHTTSSQSPPFMPFDDTLRNRDFVSKFPVPAVLGLEEVIPGTLLSYLNEYEVVTFGYEAGQHDDPQSIILHREMLWCALQFAGCLPRSCNQRLEQAIHMLRAHSADLGGCYEVVLRHGLKPNDEFRMDRGFSSFQPVKVGQRLAEQNGEVVKAPFSGRMFMPLYQSKGDDGFFLIREIPGFWLSISRWLRRWRCERWLAWLPGVTVPKHDARRVLVDPHIALFLVRQFFHLLGYRRSGEVDGRLLFVRRDK